MSPKANGVAPQTTGKATGELRPQAHGGALRNGGTNKGGPGRPPDWLKARMAYGRELAVDQTVVELAKGRLDVDQRLRVVKEWVPPEEADGRGVTITVRWAEE